MYYTFLNWWTTRNQNLSNWIVSQVTGCANFSINANDSWSESNKPNFTNCALINIQNGKEWYMDYSTEGCGQSLPLVFGSYPNVGTTPFVFLESGASIDTSGIQTTSESWSVKGDVLNILMTYNNGNSCPNDIYEMSGTIEINANLNYSTEVFSGTLDHSWTITSSNCSLPVDLQGDCNNVPITIRQ